MKNGRTAFLSSVRLHTLEGGVPILVAGHACGAVGVSGVQSDQDAQIANAGVQAILWALAPNDKAMRGSDCVAAEGRSR